MVPISELIFRLRNSFQMQATLYFQWLQWLLNTALSGKNIWMLNMDETSLQNEYLTRKGNVVDMSKDERAQTNCFFQRVDTAATRHHSTLVGVISNRPGTQHLMPQVYIPNDERLTRQEMNVYCNTLTEPVEVWRGYRGWVNSSCMKHLLTRYRRAVQSIDPNVILVLLLDSASQHISNDVLAHARRLRIVLVLIPGKLTWLLQPLDVSVFRVLKDDYKTE